MAPAHCAEAMTVSSSSRMRRIPVAVYVAIAEQSQMVLIWLARLTTGTSLRQHDKSTRSSMVKKFQHRSLWTGKNSGSSRRKPPNGRKRKTRSFDHCLKKCGRNPFGPKHLKLHHFVATWRIVVWTFTTIHALFAFIRVLIR